MYFDKCHIDQSGGPNAYKGMQIRFLRNEDGTYNPAGSHLNPEQTNTTFKYTQQARFCLGVSKVRNFETREVEGRRSRVFSYTNKKL